MARLAPPPLLRGGAPSALLAAAALLLAAGPARAQTYSTICGPARLTIPNATLAAGSFQRAVRCGYTLAGSAIFMQSFTLLNPQGALIRVMSARDANCEQPYLPYAPNSDNALGYTTTSTSFAMTGQPQSATLLASRSHAQTSFTRSMAAPSFLAVCCLRALINVAGLNKSPRDKASERSAPLPLAACDRHRWRAILLRTSSRSHACGFSGPADQRLVQSAGTAPDRSEAETAWMAGVSSPEPKSTCFWCLCLCVCVCV
jgi:hypothetical protein